MPSLLAWNRKSCQEFMPDPFPFLEFNQVCAHEIGHQLDLSSRPGAAANGQHDPGAASPNEFPTDPAGKMWVALMHQHASIGLHEKTEWLWHGDWWTANDSAGNKITNWTPRERP